MDRTPRGGVAAPSAPTTATAPRETDSDGFPPGLAGVVDADGVEAIDLGAVEALRQLTDAGGRVPVVADSVDGSGGAVVDSASVPDGMADGGATCPMPAFIKGTAGSCPVMGAADGRGVRRSRADLFMRRLLRIQEPPADQSEGEANRHFRRSMTISGIRCTLTYVIFPIALPLFSFLQGVGPFIGVVVGSIALVFDTLTVRRFFAVDHRYRWQFSALALSVMGLLVILLVQDSMALWRHLVA